ncbi:hypothetical protein PV728_01635 [Streptomyces europaeiscabiei]|uniref:hypothetical protein n=1 Tax=Streptomyces europaeiscabiei TaxID=146819 RepID=UPI0029B0FDC9|nr:hypothetical protein [Streptomyces europaeiscabiei]MDX3629030.1 hypothetical protein [Streptomyces europaeiscabiei]MDX3647352.1 hypothetical protein [Streptomyces europaeiscabiei]
MNDAGDAHTCYIRSTIDPHDRTAACLLNWGSMEVLLTPETVLNTSLDLMAAAAAAETDVAVIKVFRTKLQLDLNTIGRMVLDIRAARDHRTGKTALRISALAGARTGKPLVHIARGPKKGELTPDEAREMAQHWTEAAIAAQIDVRLRYALGEWDHLTPADIERLFSILQKVQR